MMLPLYIAALGASAGLVGIFARRLFAAQGFVPGFESGLMLAAGVAGAYAALQLAYMALLRLLKPTHGQAPILLEALSQAAALALVPYLLNVRIPWPIDKLYEVEPLLYLAAFGAAHAALKLVSLFGATQSRQSGRLGVAGWAGACILCTWASYQALLGWQASLEGARLWTPRPAEPNQVGNTWTMARPLPEGAVFPLDISGKAGLNMTLAWAPPPGQDTAPESMHITIECPGATAGPLTIPVALDSEGWAEIRVPATYFPPNPQTCTLTWSEDSVPDWVKYTGLSPIMVSDRELLLSGPWFHAPQETADTPSFLMVIVEGLGAEQTTLTGYERKTTPSLEQFAAEGLTYTTAFTPSPEAAAACMSLLTGVSPLEHGYLGPYRGLLPKGMQLLPEILREKHYATAAFTEGLAPGDEDLFYGSGFERGFEFFNPDYPTAKPKTATRPGPPPPPIPKGSRITLDRAANWLEAHGDEQFFTFLRLRELRIPQRLSRYGEGFLGRGRTPAPIDIYDTALADVDRALGVFLERIESAGLLENTCIVLTSTYGFDFTIPGRASWRKTGEPRRILSESCLHVPLCMRIPGEGTRQRPALISLEDIAPTLLNLAGTSFPHAVTGANLLDYVAAREPVSVTGEPVALSMRNKRWRYTWQSGLSPFSLEQIEEAHPIDFTDIVSYRNNRQQSNNLTRNAALAGEYQDKLKKYIEHHTGAYIPE